ncbi:energy-coupling factor ABC transporter permease [Natronincola ferrireducens]
MTAAFSLISIPVAPSSIHPLLGGLLGIIVGKRNTIAVFIGLLLQSVF